VLRVQILGFSVDGLGFMGTCAGGVGEAVCERALRGRARI